MFIFKFIFILFFFSVSLFANDFKIKKVSVHGLTHISESVFFDRIFKFDFLKSNEELFLKNLSDLGLFDKIDIYWNDNEIKIFFVEKPVIGGVKIYSDKDKDRILSILDKVDLCSGGFYDTNKIVKFKTDLREFFVSSGFGDYIIDVKVEKSINTNYVDVYINVTKNYPQRIKNVDILGSKSFNKRKLVSMLSYGKKSWMSLFLRNSIFVPMELDSNIDVLRAYYLDRGYSDFQVDFTRVFLSNDRKYVDILINVSEGERYSILAINLLGDKSIFKTDKMYDEFNDILFSVVKTGEFFYRNKLLEVKSMLKDFLLECGILDVDIYFMAFYAGEAMLKIDFIFSKFNRPRIRHINFLGNFVTCDNVLRQMVSVLEGSSLSVDDIDSSREEIVRNGLSDSVNVEYIKSSDDSHEVDIVFLVNEQNFSKFTAGFTYGNDDGFNINLTADFANFLGLGSDISLDLINNGLESDIAFTFNTPHFLGENFGVGYRLYYKSDLLDRDADDLTFMSETFGAYLYYSFELDKFRRLNFGFGGDMTIISMYDEFLSEEMRSFAERFGCDFKEYYFNLVWSYNSLDRFYYPSSGVYYNLIFRINIPGSKFMYYTVNYDLNYYNNFFDEYIFNIFSSIYYGGLYGHEDTYPFFKNFHIRSPNNIRGFKERSLGPKDSQEDSVGGNLLVCTKVSLFFPISYGLKDIKGSVFFDIGNVYDTLYYSDNDQNNDLGSAIRAIKFSFGVSLIWNTPFGLPLELSIACPFNFDDDESISVFSLSFG